jgi:hypothetical protein
VFTVGTPPICKKKFLENFGGFYLSIMKSSYSTYSKSRKMGKKFNLRIKENEEVIKRVKGE